jgi:hypothetical protein
LGDKHLEAIAHARKLRGGTNADIVRMALLLLRRQLKLDD